ncbi:MAG: AraC family transcriptional regulator [Bacteroidales bacterium]|nr:AraC family transcriptional regulator [Bacteroidales bacterium]
MTKTEIAIESAEAPGTNKASERNRVEVIPKDIEKKLQVVLRHIEESAAFDGRCDKDFNDATSVSSLARASGLSVRSLRDYFKAYIGQSLVNYISQRRAEYAARIFRLYPAVSKARAAHSIGYNCPNGIYRLMRKNGVDNIDSLRSIAINNSAIHLPFRKEYLPESILFYKQLETHYDECSTSEFEANNWDKIEVFVSTRQPEAKVSGYVGFAIDRYISGDKDSGTFICGILFQKIHSSELTKDIIGNIGWRLIPTRRYVVFTYKGNYDGLTQFYDEVIATINNSDLNIDIATPYMEKYLNSPTDTPVEELITELWVALAD